MASSLGRIENDIDGRHGIVPRHRHDGEFESPMLGTIDDIEPTVSLTLLWVWFCCFGDDLGLRLVDMHRVDDGLPVFIETERSVIAVWWAVGRFIAFSYCFVLTIDPGAVTVAPLLPGDQPRRHAVSAVLSTFQ